MDTTVKLNKLKSNKITETISIMEPRAEEAKENIEVFAIIDENNVKLYGLLRTPLTPGPWPLIHYV